MKKPLFNKVLVANRGEIALRIMRTLRDLEIPSVAIYSDADAGSLHRKYANEAIHLPGRASKDTYLNVDAILEAIRLTGADAVHPGYGFLSENAAFCAAVNKMGVKFIGPSDQAMHLMGDKVQAKNLMKKHNVPTVPGSDGALGSLDELQELAQKIGYPIILKAAAGGGGRGMRIVRQDAELKDSFEACKREALSYFGDGTVFAERYVSNPRHIEIQVLCDGKRGVHLFERDCSVQRRHQKLIEEAPSRFLNQEQRTRLGEIAVRAALAADYEGVGTVEFICESPDRAYFMEMNTRIQVEHPVTEMITGVDLIQEQIRVAATGELRLTQDDIQIRGWSIETRINAEDPAQDFMPNPGQITHLHLPAGPGMRVDTHIYAGYTIPSDYDSMVAKFISYGADRDEAIQRMLRALAEFECDGVPTTAKFHEVVLKHPAFVSGEFDTGFLALHQKEIEAALKGGPADDEWSRLFTAFQAQVKADGRRGTTASGPSQWQLRARHESCRH
ncbi:acetyl-CoA carboxylase biotin carboxylase subunit [Oligoflexus tunisiensis]|uniref:acetyl-CoA carboxylase biotin carboxylase subunit n=1 Tax=Oligoflexus tunisiensis TaxID=708132 RepID=UPI000AAF01F1|nr:acetyl-CoA carboxylase biotin carboxylase subunit [Oligoflexus tunisiensis]